MEMPAGHTAPPHIVERHPMNRVQRLHRSAIVCGAIVVGLLMLTVPATRNFVAGDAGLMWVLLIAMLVVGAIGVGFIWMADKVSSRTQA